MEKEFTLCKFNGMFWDCKRGYDSLFKMNIEAKKHKGFTTFFEGYKMTPDVIRWLYVKWLLIPRISIKSNSS